MMSTLTDQYAPAPLSKLRKRPSKPVDRSSAATSATTTLPFAKPSSETATRVFGNLAPFITICRDRAAHATLAGHLRDPLAAFYNALAKELATALEDAQRGAGVVSVAEVALATGRSTASVKRRCTSHGPRVGAMKLAGTRTWLIDFAIWQAATPTLDDRTQEAA